jgi:hypothetical protein
MKRRGTGYPGKEVKSTKKTGEVNNYEIFTQSPRTEANMLDGQLNTSSGCLENENDPPQAD